MPTGNATSSPIIVKTVRLGNSGARYLFSVTPSLNSTTMLLANPIRKARYRL